MDPVLDAGRYDISEYVTNPRDLVQYLYVQNNPLIFVDPTGENGLAVSWGSKLWTLIAVDGPLPYGDMIYVVGFGICVLVDGVTGNLALYSLNRLWDIDERVQKVMGYGVFYPVEIPKVSSPQPSVEKAEIALRAPASTSAADLGLAKGTREIAPTKNYMPAVGCTGANTAQNPTGGKAEADERTASSYEEAKKTGQKAPKHKDTKKTGSDGLSTTIGEPNSSEDLVDSSNDNFVIQRRYYGPDGRAEFDVDYTNHHRPDKHPNVPHGHEWDWTTDPKHPSRREVPLPWLSYPES